MEPLKLNATLEQQPVASIESAIDLSNDPKRRGKPLFRGKDRLYCIRLEPLPEGIVNGKPVNGIAQYWMTASEIETHVRGGFAALRALECKTIREAVTA